MLNAIVLISAPERDPLDPASLQPSRKAPALPVSSGLKWAALACYPAPAAVS